MLLLLAFLLFCLTSSAFATAPTNAPTYIVLLDRSVDVNAAAQLIGARPSFVYHGNVHGFAANLDANTVAALKHVSDISVLPSPAPVIVSLPATADPRATVAAMGLHPKFVYGTWKKPAWFKGNQFKGFAVSLDAPGLAKLDADNRIADVEPDGHLTLCNQTNGAGIIRMGITNFPVAQINGRDERIDVDVAVLDTGIQIDTTNLATNALFLTTIHGPHPDLPPVVHAVSFADPGYYGDDFQGHGTGVAGIIGALDNNIGVVGVAPGVRLWDVQVMSPGVGGQGGGTWANVLAGLDYIAQHADQIEVVNASIADLSGSTPYSAAEQAVASIVNQGTVFVAAAGNSGIDVCGNDFVCGTSDDVLPAALPEVMCVGGMLEFNDTTGFWDYSLVPRSTYYVFSPGLNIDVDAPAGNYPTTEINSGYQVFGATSGATAHVTGLVALYIAANGRATNAAGVYHIRQEIIDHSLPQSQWRPNGQPFDASTNNTGDFDGYPEPLAIASEAWVPKPEFYSERLTSNGFTLNFGIVPGYQYTVQYRDSLAGTNHWQDLTVTNGTGKLTPVTVTYPAPAQQRFYRLKRIPTP